MENSPAPRRRWGGSNRSRRGSGFARGTSRAGWDLVPGGRRRQGAGGEGVAGTGTRLRKPGSKVPIVSCQPPNAAKPAGPTGVSGALRTASLDDLFDAPACGPVQGGRRGWVGRAQVESQIPSTNRYQAEPSAG